MTLARTARHALCWVALGALLGCASSSVVVRGGGVGLEEALAEPASGKKYRIAVAPIVDKSGSRHRSLYYQLTLMNAQRVELERLQPAAITEGVRDMLVTELFGSKRFIVLDRAMLDQVLVEQEFTQGLKVGETTRLPLGELEGAELLVIGAITSFDAGTELRRIAIPFVFDDDDLGVLGLGFARGQVVMDLRVVDVRTGRVVASAAVRGRNDSAEVSLDAVLNNGDFRIALPKVLTAFRNTPVERALQEMVTAAVGQIAARAERGSGL